MQNRWTRILRHRWLDERDAARAVDADARKRLEARVAASEKHHSGEIRLCVEASLPLSYLWKRLTPRDRALMLFSKLRVWDTEHRNGVLVYLLLAEHAIEIVADRGLARRVPQSLWDEVVAGMGRSLGAGRFEDGLAQAIDAVDAQLTRHFAAVPGQANPDELPNRVDLR